MKVLAACLGDCVHVAGVTRFLRVAEDLGYETYFTGPATDLEALVDAIIDRDADIVGISYRLTPENLRPLLYELRDMLAAAGVDLQKKRLAFAGPPPVVAVAREFDDLFEQYFEGGEPTLFYPILLKSVQAANDMGFRAGIVSNASGQTAWKTL